MIRLTERVWNLVFQIKWGTDTEGVWDCSADYEIAGQWKQFDNDELRDFHSTPNIIKKVKLSL
jgi:hypothetical protein